MVAQRSRREPLHAHVHTITRAHTLYIYVYIYNVYKILKFAHKLDMYV